MKTAGLIMNCNKILQLHAIKKVKISLKKTLNYFIEYFTWIFIQSSQIFLHIVKSSYFKEEYLL